MTDDCFGFDKIDDNGKEYSKKDLAYSVDFDSTIVKLPLADVVVENIKNVDSLQDVQFAFSIAKTLDDKQTVFQENLELILDEFSKKFGKSSGKVRKKKIL